MGMHAAVSGSVGFVDGSGFSDLYPGCSDPDPTHLPAIDIKTIFLKHHITNKKFSQRPVNYSGDKREK
jgi:hypothetical protein